MLVVIIFVVRSQQFDWKSKKHSIDATITFPASSGPALRGPLGLFTAHSREHVDKLLIGVSNRFGASPGDHAG